MREIKFRAFEKSLGMTLPVDAIDFCENYVVVHIEDNYMEWYLNDAILEQYTGLKDIYEGDFLDDDGDYWLVKFCDGAFVGEFANVLEPIENLADLEVIGNIHQNPELLEG